MQQPTIPRFTLMGQGTCGNISQWSEERQSCEILYTMHIKSMHNSLLLQQQGWESAWSGGMEPRNRDRDKFAAGK